MGAFLSWRYICITIVLLISAQALILYSFGQPMICACGYVKLWENVVLSPGNSQHIADWYTFSHLIHGILFYALTWVMFPRMHWKHRLVIALALEIAWEVIENTPTVINHYREQALAQGYTGDSILNSICDTIFAGIGFLTARRSPVWLSIALIISMELFTGFMIRDGLALNIINLIYPISAIGAWQSGT